MQKKYFLILLVITTLMLASCKPRPPKGVLSAGKLEKVLYDYHLAQAMAQQSHSDSIDYNMRRYQDAVFRKHNIDVETFNHTMEWYERHTDRLEAIYKNLAERFGEGNSDFNNLSLANNSLSGDTLSLWHGVNFVILNSQTASHYAFTEKADTAVQQGDLIQWIFFADWHYHDGQREATALLSIRYEGDSVATMQSAIVGQGRQMVAMRVGKRKVLRIEGFVYQHSPWSSRPRIITLSMPQLLRIRRQEEEKPLDAVIAEPVNVTDTTKHRALTPNHRLRDSLLRADSLNEQKPHFR